MVYTLVARATSSVAYPVLTSNLWIQVMLAAMSACGGLGIMAIIIYYNMFSKVRSQIIFALGITDFLAGINLLVPAAQTIAGHPLINGSASCTLSAFFYSIFLVAVTGFSGLIGLYTYMLLVKPLHALTGWLRRPVSVIVLSTSIYVIAAVYAAVGIGLYRSSNIGALCYFREDAGLYPELASFVPRAVVFLFLIIVYVRLFFFFHTRNREVIISSHDEDGPNAIDDMVFSGSHKGPISVSVAFSEALSVPASPSATVFANTTAKRDSIVTANGEERAHKLPIIVEQEIYTTITREEAGEKQGSSSKSENRWSSLSATDVEGSSPLSRLSETDVTDVEKGDDLTRAISADSCFPVAPEPRGRITIPTSDEILAHGEFARQANASTAARLAEDHTRSGGVRLQVPWTSKTEQTSSLTRNRASAVELNARTAKLLMLYPLAYLTLFSVAMGRLLYILSTHKATSPAVQALARYLIFSQGIVDFSIFGLSEWLFRRNNRGRL